MKILQIVPVMDSAITFLAQQIIRHNKDIDIKLCTLHPKRPDKVDIDYLKKHWKDADLIDVQYWKSGAKARELLGDVWHTKKKLLSHYNPYNLHEERWTDYCENVVVNSFQQTQLPYAKLIPLAIDQNFYSFRKMYTVDPVVNMVVNRIEGKKGVFEVAKACNELGYKFLLVGRVADSKYMDNVRKAGGKNLTFLNGVPDEAVRDAYYGSAIHVCNSQDFFESGSMPILEAMSTGVPVVSRMIGHVPDLYATDPEKQNLHIYTGHNEDVAALKDCLAEVMSGRNYRIKLRLNAVESIKDRTDIWRAAEYRKLYTRLIES